MLVEDVLPNPFDLVAVVVIEPGIEIERYDGRFLGDEDGFRLAEKLGALFQVGLLIGFTDERVVTPVFPAGAILPLCS
jgi:hypothetical protein